MTVSCELLTDSCELLISDKVSSVRFSVDAVFCGLSFFFGLFSFVVFGAGKVGFTRPLAEGSFDFFRAILILALSDNAYKKQSMSRIYK